MNSEELTRFSSTVLAIHQCQAPADLGPVLVQALGTLCDSDSEVVQTIGGQSLQICGSSRPVPDELLEIQNSHITEHPLFWIIGHAAAGGEPVAGKWSDHTTLRAFRQTGLYHDFFRILDVKHQAAATVRVNDEITLGLSLHRARSDFRPEDVQLFQLLLPHVREATRRMIGQVEVAAALEWQEMAIGREAALIVDEQGALLFATQRARELIRDYFTTTLPDGLPPEIGTWLRRNPGPDAKFTRTLLGRSLTCLCGSRTSRKPDGLEPFFPPESRSRFLRRLRLVEQNEASAHAVLRTHGLSPREAEVLHWMAEGKRNGEIAIILSISQRTVEKHGEKIFAKLNVETRTAAVACCRELLSS